MPHALFSIRFSLFPNCLGSLLLLFPILQSQQNQRRKALWCLPFCAMTMATLPAHRQFPGTNAAAFKGVPPLHMVLPKGRHPPVSLFILPTPERQPASSEPLEDADTHTWRRDSETAFRRSGLFVVFADWWPPPAKQSHLKPMTGDLLNSFESFFLCLTCFIYLFGEHSQARAEC